VNQHGVVSQIIDQSPNVLRYLSELGLTPGAEVTLVKRSPINDTVGIRVGDATHTISTQVAAECTGDRGIGGLIMGEITTHLKSIQLVTVIALPNSLRSATQVSNQNSGGCAQRAVQPNTPFF